MGVRAASVRSAMGLEMWDRLVQNVSDLETRRLLDKTPNQTFYQFGYLYFADQLCYWDRERIEVTNLVRGESTPVPPC